jgi:hypothetical protein
MGADDALERETSLAVGFRRADANETNSDVCRFQPIFGQMGASPDHAAVSNSRRLIQIALNGGAQRKSVTGVRSIVVESLGKAEGVLRALV